MGLFAASPSLPGFLQRKHTAIQTDHRLAANEKGSSYFENVHQTNQTPNPLMRLQSVIAKQMERKTTPIQASTGSALSHMVRKEKSDNGGMQ
ncbi:hypothetical protein BaRGS_00028279 [Batillaria attramentaria]|uniref:Uncharacterized protein n=1 Tax=Batillaria attramentaria TaxID=370345 RepID=A0ABD0K085_9CAEN